MFSGSIQEASGLKGRDGIRLASDGWRWQKTWWNVTGGTIPVRGGWVPLLPAATSQPEFMSEGKVNVQIVKSIAWLAEAWFLGARAPLGHALSWERRARRASCYHAVVGRIRGWGRGRAGCWLSSEFSFWFCGNRRENISSLSLVVTKALSAPRASFSCACASGGLSVAVSLSGALSAGGGPRPPDSSLGDAGSPVYAFTGARFKYIEWRSDFAPWKPRSPSQALLSCKARCCPHIKTEEGEGLASQLPASASFNYGSFLTDAPLLPDSFLFFFSCLC